MGRNRKKIIELIKQRPEVNRNYCWDIVYHEAEAQSETFLIRYLVVKGFFDNHKDAGGRKHFLPRTTFRKLKNCYRIDNDRKMLEEISLMKEKEDKMLQEISLTKENIEKIQAKLSTL